MVIQMTCRFPREAHLDYRLSAHLDNLLSQRDLARDVPQDVPRASRASHASQASRLSSVVHSEQTEPLDELETGRRFRWVGRLINLLVLSREMGE